MKHILICALTLLPLPVLAQEDDKGWLTNWLEENLSGAGRQVVIDGFQGALSSQARIERLTIADDQGIWLALSDVKLDWNRAALLQGRIEVAHLTAAEIVLERLPQAEESGGLPTPEAAPFRLPDLPVSINIGDLGAARIVLGETVLGQSVIGTAQASLRLSGGSATAQLQLERLDDGPDGKVALEAGFTNMDRILRLNLTAEEAAGGIAATLAGLPGAPAVALTVKGEGPLEDFTADLTLASDGTPRLTGNVAVRATEGGGTGFSADLGGDLAPLFLPQYAAFFGNDIQLKALGSRDALGALRLDDLSLDTRALSVAGKLQLAADGLPQAFDLALSLGLDGQPVLLPLTGPETRVLGGDLALKFDAAQGDRWNLTGDLRGLSREGFDLAQVALEGQGSIRRQQGGASRAAVDGSLRFAAQGILPADPALAQALGPALAGSADFQWHDQADALSLPRLEVSGDGIALEGSAEVHGLSTGLTIATDLSARIADLSRASGLAGRPLGGAVTARINGSAAALSGQFDLNGDLTGTGLRMGIPEADRLLSGASTIAFSVRRDETGTNLRLLDVKAASLSASAKGKLSSRGSDITADLAFSDLSALGPRYRGGLTAEATLEGTVDNGRVILRGTGRNLGIGQPEADRVLAGTSALEVALQLDGSAIRIERATITNPQLSAETSGAVVNGAADLQLAARLANMALVVPEFPGPLTVEGRLRQQAGGYGLDVSMRGPGGIDLTAAGRLSGDLARAEGLQIRGTSQAALANAFISPRRVAGGLRFDLTVNGPLAVQSLSGNVALSDGRFAATELPFTLEGIGANARLSGGRASIDGRANLSSGGAVAVTGSLGLSAPFDADLRADLGNLTIRDARLFEARLSGGLTVNGPLTGGAVIGGRINILEANLRVPSTGLLGADVLEPLAHVGDSAEVRATRQRANADGAGSTPSGASARPFRLDVQIDAPNRLFLRGRGLDAEIGGSFRIGGTTTNLQPSGALELIRGRLDILGKRLTLTQADLTMEGDLMPDLDILASTRTDTVTASVRIAGPANQPQVTFESSPQLPQEEVLAQLLFGRDLTQLSAFQAAQLASAVATLAGRGGEGIISKLRKGVGLDDLDVQTGESGGTSVTAGKYLSRNLYTEVTVGDDGTSEIDLNLDLTDSITLRGSTGSDGQTGLGIFFEKDY